MDLDGSENGICWPMISEVNDTVESSLTHFRGSRGGTRVVKCRERQEPAVGEGGGGGLKAVCSAAFGRVRALSHADGQCQALARTSVLPRFSAHTARAASTSSAGRSRRPMSDTHPIKKEGRNPQPDCQRRHPDLRHQSSPLRASSFAH